MVKLEPGAVLIHRPTGRPVKVVKVTEESFEVVTLDDWGCRWELFNIPERWAEFEGGRTWKC